VKPSKLSLLNNELRINDGGEKRKYLWALSG
jgi:hypothetical protein